MGYAQLERLFGPLGHRERLQLTDYIVTTYNVIDYQATINCFGSYERLLTAVHSTTGSEYDLREYFVGKSDACYNQMTNLLLREEKLKDIHDLLSLSIDERTELFLFLQRSLDVLPKQIAKYLHITLKKG